MSRSGERGLRLGTALLAGTIAIVAATGPAAAAKLIGEWKLKGTLKNAAGTPVKMSAIGSPTFDVTSVKGTQRKALVFDEGEGLRVARVPKKARSSYSVSVLTEFDAVDGYRRIMSFGPNTVDEGLYILDGELDLYDQSLDGPVVTAPDQWMRVHVTRNGSTRRMNMYVDGVKILTHKDRANEYKLGKGRVIFFQDNLVGGGTEEHPSGTAAGIRIWQGVKAP